MKWFRRRKPDQVDAHAAQAMAALTQYIEPEGPEVVAYFSRVAAVLDADPNVQIDTMQARRRDALWLSPVERAAWKAIVKDLEGISK
jgi:hypothetical protein